MKLHIHNNRSLDCDSSDCPFRKECAQHDTAGDYRTESGFSPEIEKQGDDYICLTRNAEVDMDIDLGVYPVGERPSGCVYISNGELKIYGGPYEDME